MKHVLRLPINGDAINEVAVRIDRDKAGLCLRVVQGGCVLLNGKRIRKARLAPNDRIEIGDCRIISASSTDLVDIEPLVSLCLQRDNAGLDFTSLTRAFQKELISMAISRVGGCKNEAAKLLGMSRSTFFRYAAALGI